MIKQTLQVGGFTPMTSIDFPGELSAVVFCQGCPWRCRYCHNPELLPRKTDQLIAWEEVLGFLETRRGLLDAVVFSGGEPTLQRELPVAVDQVKDLGFKVGLHSSGAYPERLAALLPKLDWVGLDIKALPDNYQVLTGIAGSGERAWESAVRLISSDVAHEIRTTVCADLIQSGEIVEITRRLEKLGTGNHVLQACLPTRNVCN